MTRAKHQQHVEYRLLIEHAYDETLKKEGIRFFLETTKQFTNFSYQIDIKEALNAQALQWSLHGLRAPSMNMPETGTAQFSKIYFELPATIVYTLVKKGKMQASATIKISPTSIKVSDDHPGFLKIYTNKQDFENNRMTDTEPPEYKPDLLRAPVDHHPTPNKKKKV